MTALIQASLPSAHLPNVLLFLTLQADQSCVATAPLRKGQHLQILHQTQSCDLKPAPCTTWTCQLSSGQQIDRKLVLQLWQVWRLRMLAWVAPYQAADRKALLRFSRTTCLTRCARLPSASTAINCAINSLACESMFTTSIRALCGVDS